MAKTQVKDLTQLNGNIIDTIAKKIAHEAPQLADLPPDQLRRIAKAVVFDELKDSLRVQVEAARIDYEDEKETFLKTSHSIHTARAYRQALERLEIWCTANGKMPVTLTPKDADDFIYAISAEGRSAASVRLDISASSAFFTWLERRHNSIRNPFRGTRARPKRTSKKTLQIPDEKDMAAIIEYFKGSTRAAVIIMAGAGLRVGALPSLTIREGKYTCETKSKTQKGTLPMEAHRVLKPLGSKPFADRTAAGIAESFAYGIRVLYKTKTIQARYSCHDLRHYFAVKEYSKDKDIYTLSKKLGHSNINITQMYLRSLDILDN
jgi:site-specific recombinase XerD